MQSIADYNKLLPILITAKCIPFTHVGEGNDHLPLLRHVVNRSSGGKEQSRHSYVYVVPIGEQSRVWETGFVFTPFSGTGHATMRKIT